MAAERSVLPLHQQQTLTGHDGSVMSVRFTVDGTYCLTAGRDRLVRLWNPHTGLMIKVYKGHGFEVNDAVAADKHAYVWDVSEGTVLRKFRGHSGVLNAVRFNEDATVVFTASYDATVKAWDCRANNAEPIQTLSEAKDSVTSIQVHQHELLTGSVDGLVRHYDLRMGQLKADFVAAPVTSVAFSHDNNCLLASSLDSTIRLLDKDSGELLCDYTAHKNKAYKVESCLTHDDSHVVSGSEDGDICFWNLVEGRLVTRLQAHKGSVVTSVSYHPRKPLLLSAAANGSIHQWGFEEIAGNQEDT